MSAPLLAGLVAQLNATVALTAVCGQSIMPPPAPDNLSEYPALTYERITWKEQYDLAGQVSLCDSTVVLTCIAAQYSQCEAMVLAIRNAFSGFRGTLPNGVVVYLTQIVAMHDLWEPNNQMQSIAVHLQITFAA